MSPESYDKERGRTTGIGHVEIRPDKIHAVRLDFLLAVTSRMTEKINTKGQHDVSMEAPEPLQ